MKKYISILLSLAMLLSSALAVGAAECNHSYLRSFVSATCTEKGHTLYTCQRCKESYKVYDDEYTEPEGFYIIAKSVRENDTLTVTVELWNNPGLIAARIQAGYNASTLALREFINGEIWTSRDFTGGINYQGNPLTVFAEDYSTGEQNNSKNGIYFTLVFDIIDPEGSYGFYLTHKKADFPSWKSLVSNTPTIINLVGKKELGPHSYTSTSVLPSCTDGGYTAHSCSLCGHSYKSDETEPNGHSLEFSKTVTSPDFENEGSAEYVCTVCSATELCPIPVLEHWKKGDLNGDTRINAIDTNIMRRLLAGMSASLQATDAADINGDSKLNAIDANTLKHIMSGS